MLQGVLHARKHNLAQTGEALVQPEFCVEAVRLARALPPHGQRDVGQRPGRDERDPQGCRVALGFAVFQPREDLGLVPADGAFPQFNGLGKAARGQQIVLGEILGHAGESTCARIGRYARRPSDP